MKKYLFILMLLAMSAGACAQTAQQVLKKTASIVGRPGGCAANFKLSSAKFGSTSGRIAIKGQKFQASTPKAMIWFDGTTQWSYLSATNEVNVSKPTQAQQMSMNPMTFIHIYQTGYTPTMTKKGNNFIIRLVAKNQRRTVQEMELTINRKTYVPSVVRMRQGKTWSTISISGFSARNQSNSTFTFNAKDYPTAEVIDLR